MLVGIENVKPNPYRDFDLCPAPNQSGDVRVYHVVPLTDDVMSRVHAMPDKTLKTVQRRKGDLEKRIKQVLKTNPDFDLVERLYECIERLSAHERAIEAQKVDAAAIAKEKEQKRLLLGMCRRQAAPVVAAEASPTDVSESLAIAYDDPTGRAN